MSVNPFVALVNISDDLDLVQQCVLETLTSDFDLLDGAAKHLATAGGKQIRPSLTLTCAKIAQRRYGSAISNPTPSTPDLAQKSAAEPKAGSAASVAPALAQDLVWLEKFPAEVVGAAAVELVHLGSLYHDDVIDAAQTRRSVPAANRKYGNTVAILAGDLMLAKACSLAAWLGPTTSHLLSCAISALVAGQVREVADLANLDRTEDSYFAAIEGKTAALLSCATSMGALSAARAGTGTGTGTGDTAPNANGVGGGGSVDVLLARFGRCFGMAFQIVDDVLDCVADSDVLGKPAGNDLLESNFTLPVIYALADAKVGASLRKILAEPLSVGRRDEALALIRATDAIDRSRSKAGEFAREALGYLDDLGSCEGTESLRYATDTLLSRTH